MYLVHEGTQMRLCATVESDAGFMEVHQIRSKCLYYVHNACGLTVLILTWLGLGRIAQY